MLVNMLSFLLQRFHYFLDNCSFGHSQITEDEVLSPHILLAPPIKKKREEFKETVFEKLIIFTISKHLHSRLYKICILYIFTNISNFLGRYF